MAIKVTGTTVINDSRDLENITNVSEFVKGVNFIDVPDLFIDGAPDNVIDPTPTLTTSEFFIFGGGSDTHASTDWEVIRTSDSTTVFSSIGDTTNLTSIDVTAELDNEEHLIRVRHNGASLGASEYREVKVTVDAPFEPTTLGEAGAGGFYMGTIAAAGTTYYLIVAPNATGCACCQWKTTTSSGEVGTSDDGYANTYPTLENSTYPAGNWTATRTINGFSDWYLPAIDELVVFYNNGGGNGPGDPLPSGEDFTSDKYWSSSPYNRCNKFMINFSSGSIQSDGCIQTLYFNTRAVRRVPI